MGDSEDEHYVTFGTPLDPLDEDNMPRKKPITIEDQYACDEQGRRRFHGAFTGGFSAGYFNTVGTRDGWRPQNFKSSRSSKAENKAQTPQDFMDDEDIGEFGIAPTAIRARSDYTDHSSQGVKRQRNKCDPDGPIPGTPVLQEILEPVKDTVGVKLLKQMGWKPGQGAGPRISKKEKSRIRQQNEKLKVYGCSVESRTQETVDSDSDASDTDTGGITFAPDDYELFRCNPKDNFFGIGYSGLDKRSILSQHVNLFEPTAFKLQEKNKKLSIRGQAFGVGAFEAEDEDIYSREDMSQYDFSLEPKKKSKSRWSSEKSSTSSKDCIDGFAPAKNALATVKVFKLPELPKDFKPIHVIRKSRFEPAIESTSLENARRKGLGRHDISAQDRARIINDPNPITLVLSQQDKNDCKLKTDDLEANTDRSKSQTLNSRVLETKFEQALVSNSTEYQTDSRSRGVDQHKPPKPSVISNIISRTLNLHGKKESLQDQEKSMGGSNVPSKSNTNDLQSSSKNSWLEKCKTMSFVKGGAENMNEHIVKPSEIILTPTDVTNTINALQPSTNRLPTLTEENTGCESRSGSSNESSAFKPFVMNPDKQKRYENFLELSKTGEKEKLLSIQPLSMTEWERDHERVEFEQAARLYKPLTGKMSERFVSGNQQDNLDPLNVVEKTKDSDHQLREAAAKKFFGKLTRQRIEWQPAAIVCKRFNIAEPRTAYANEKTGTKTKYSVFDYLEESVHSNSTFQSAADFTERIKSNIDSSRNSVRETYTPLDTRLAAQSAMLVHDNTDIENVSAKERNFQAQYVKVFGKNVDNSKLVAKQDSTATSMVKGDKTSDELVDIGITGQEPNTMPSRTQDPPTLEATSTESATGSILGRQNAEKKDLFKSIFLSSSEDSDSEREEVDDEKLKSVLIGRNPSKMNVQRNNSPPRGIFANLDLDSLNAINVKKEKTDSIASHSLVEMDVRNATTARSTSSDLNIAGSIESINGKDSTKETECRRTLAPEMLPDMYGPILPTRPPNIQSSEIDASSQCQQQKPVFKSIVVPVSGSSTMIRGEWVEKRKNKTKKEKKKHKHKEHKKHKHKKHKR